MKRLLVVATAASPVTRLARGAAQVARRAGLGVDVVYEADPRLERLALHPAARFLGSRGTPVPPLPGAQAAHAATLGAALRAALPDEPGEVRLVAPGEAWGPAPRPDVVVLAGPLRAAPSVAPTVLIALGAEGTPPGPAVLLADHNDLEEVLALATRVGAPVVAVLTVAPDAARARQVVQGLRARGLPADPRWWTTLERVPALLDQDAPGATLVVDARSDLARLAPRLARRGSPLVLVHPGA